VKRVFIFVLLSLASGCSPGCNVPPAGDDGEPDAQPQPADCAADAPAFVREASLAILGHRPSSQHEVDAYVALYQQVEAAKAAGTSTANPREVVARAMLARPEKIDRWTIHFMDALRVTRIDDQSQAACWKDALRAAADPALATYVRDNAPTATGTGAFSMLDLARSAIALDDPTPIYRAHLFPLVSAPIIAANVPPVEAELARREDFGNAFDAAYLNRDVVCLGCHNSETSVTYSIDPKMNRHWPIAGHVDAAVFGMSMGEDPAKAHAVFRVDGFAADQRGSRRPWGMSGDCGMFIDPSSVPADPAGVDGALATLRGQRLTVYDLDRVLKKGFDALRGGSIAVGPDGSIADPDQALAYMVATNIVEGVWREAVGTRLTIANYFPRNQAARDVLQQLTDDFVKNGYSLDDLLVDVVTSDYFARKPPEAGCGATPYDYPAIYDPWTYGDADAAKRGNGPGDAIAPVSARTLLSSAYAGLEWSAPPDEQFPSDETGCEQLSCNELAQACAFGECCDTYDVKCKGQPPASSPDELPFLRSVGVYLKSGERGFRGLDFQARLGWEDRFGACKKPARVKGMDFIDRARAAGAAASGATVGDVVSVIKDRLIGEPSVSAGAEQNALEALVGTSMSSPASMLSDAGARRLCGVLLSSPQFVLQGMAGRGGTASIVSVPGDGFDDACAKIANAKLAGWTVTCASGALTAVPQ